MQAEDRHDERAQVTRSNGSDERPLVDVAEFSRGCYRVVFSSSKTARRSPSPSRCLSVPGHKPCNDEIRTVTDRFQATKVYRFATVSQLGKDPSHRLSPPPVDFCLPWREDDHVPAWFVAVPQKAYATDRIPAARERQICGRTDL